MGLGIEDLRADADRQELPAGMFIGVAEREEREKALVIRQLEVVDQNVRRARHVAQDRAMVLQHAARCPAGAAGIDDAGGVLAADTGKPRLDRTARRLGIAFDHVRPAMAGQIAPLVTAHAFDRDDMFGNPGMEDRRDQRAGQLLVRNDHCLRARIVQDMDVIAFGIGDVGGHVDAARGHDRQIGNAPFGAVLRHQHHPVAIGKAQAAQVFCQHAHLLGRFAPADRLPLASDLAPEEGLVAAFVGALQEQRDEIARLFDLSKLRQRRTCSQFLVCL